MSVNATLPVANPADEQFMHYMYGLGQGATGLNQLAGAFDAFNTLRNNLNYGKGAGPIGSTTPIPTIPTVTPQTTTVQPPNYSQAAWVNFQPNAAIPAPVNTQFPGWIPSNMNQSLAPNFQPNITAPNPINTQPNLNRSVMPNFQPGVQQPAPINTQAGASQSFLPNFQPNIQQPSPINTDPTQSRMSTMPTQQAGVQVPSFLKGLSTADQLALSVGGSALSGLVVGGLPGAVVGAGLGYLGNKVSPAIFSKAGQAVQSTSQTPASQQSAQPAPESKQVATTTAAPTTPETEWQKKDREYQAVMNIPEANRTAQNKAFIKAYEEPKRVKARIEAEKEYLSLQKARKDLIKPDDPDYSKAIKANEDVEAKLNTDSNFTKLYPTKERIDLPAKLWDGTTGFPAKQQIAAMYKAELAGTTPPGTTADFLKTLYAYYLQQKQVKQKKTGWQSWLPSRGSK